MKSKETPGGKDLSSRNQQRGCQVGTTARSRGSSGQDASGPLAGSTSRESSGSGKRENRSKVRLVLGSKKLKRWWRCCEDEHHGKGESQGSKKSFKSETEEDGSNKTRVRIFQPPEKRARSIAAGH